MTLASPVEPISVENAELRGIVPGYREGGEPTGHFDFGAEHPSDVVCCVKMVGPHTRTMKRVERNVRCKEQASIPCRAKWVPRRFSARKADKWEGNVAHTLQGCQIRSYPGGQHPLFRKLGLCDTGEGRADVMENVVRKSRTDGTL